MADALGTPGGVVSDEDHRLDQAGLIAPQTSSIDVRTGVLLAPGSTALVTGTSATGTMTVAIAAHHWVTSRQASDGVYLGTLEAATTVNIAAAPGANSRIDVVYVKQNDAASTVSPDVATAPEYGVATGTAAVSPTKPDIPVGAVELATVTVAVGATSTNGAGVTIANTARQTVARGAPVPCRNQAERDALTGFDGLQAFRLDTGEYETYRPGGWGPSQGDRPWVEHLRNTAYSYALTGTMATITSGSFNVTVPAGRTLDVEFKAPRITIASGGDSRTRLLIGGVMQEAHQFSLGPNQSMYLPVRLTGSVVGTGASVAVAVQAQTVSGASSLDSGGPAGPVILRYRIW